MKKMIVRLVLGSFASMVAVSANAGVMKRACGFKDFQTITTALEKGQIMTGKEKRNAILSVLQEEMGPQCNELIPTEPQGGISGHRFIDYELIRGSERIALTIVIGGVEDPGVKVYLE